MNITNLLLGVLFCIISGVLWYVTYKMKRAEEDGFDKSNTIEMSTAAGGFGLIGIYFISSCF